MSKRRDFLKLSAIASAGAAAHPARGQLCAPPALAFAGSPATPPWVWPLRIPRVATPVARLDPPPDPARHQRYDEFAPALFYDFNVRAIRHQFHPALAPTLMWGYDGICPGPTVHARYGQPILVRMRNNLPQDHVGFGLPSIATHLHNGHTASESDGYPGDFADPGQYRDHHYGNFPAGHDAREVMSTLWYHDHREDFTAQNVVRGLTGFYLLFDDLDTGNERDPDSRAFRLPSGPYDVPMIFHDRAFDADGQMVYDVFNTAGILGDRYTVNNVIQPFFEVSPRKYRFRLLNGGPSRFYRFSLSNGQKMVQLSNDGNMLPAPVEVPWVILSPAERADVIIDFSRYKRGDQIFLVNDAEQTAGEGPTGRALDPPQPLVRFDVGNDDRTDPSRVPDVLRPLPPVTMSEVATERFWKFDYLNGTWLVNGKLFDTNRIDAQVKRGTAEIWTFRNEGATWAHPIHIHFEEFQILSINGRAPAPGEVDKSRKDTVRLGPNDEIKIYMRFRDFLGRYVMHCHNVVHEDHSMMIRFDVVP